MSKEEFEQIMAEVRYEEKILKQQITQLTKELQQERKDFKETNDYCFELNLRIDKAIKYIDTNFCIENRRDLKEVVNILQGSEDNE